MSPSQEAAKRMHAASDFARSLRGTRVAVRATADADGVKRYEFGLMNAAGKFVSLASGPTWEDAERALVELQGKPVSIQEEIDRG